MKTTTNLGLKKIELKDSPPDITVQDFNWDKIDSELKKHDDAIGENTSQLAQIASDITAAFSTVSTYSVGDYCIYNNILYRCTTAITVASVWDVSKWVVTSMDAEMKKKLAIGNDYRPNLLINGDFQIWQRGTSFSNTPFGYTADRWSHGYDGTGGTNIISKLSQIGNPFKDAVRWQCSVTGTGNTYKVLEQRIENVQLANDQTVTLSFFAKADANGRVMGGNIVQIFGSGGSDAVNHYLPLVNLTTSWKLYSYVIKLSSTNGKTIGTNSYLSVILSLQNNIIMTTDIANVKLEINDHATSFSPRLYAEELALCQRYFQPIIEPYQEAGFLTRKIGSNRGVATVDFSVPMRTAPTLVQKGASASKGRLVAIYPNGNVLSAQTDTITDIVLSAALKNRAELLITTSLTFNADYDNIEIDTVSLDKGYYLDAEI